MEVHRYGRLLNAPLSDADGSFLTISVAGVDSEFKGNCPVDVDSP